MKAAPGGVRDKLSRLAVIAQDASGLRPMLVLCVVVETGADLMTLGEIAEELGLASSLVSRAANRLEEMSACERLPRDGRTSYLVATRGGKDIHRKLRLLLVPSGAKAFLPETEEAAA